MNTHVINQTRCPHGIVSDYVYATTTIRGETYAVGGDYWHTPDERCRAGDQTDRRAI